MNKAQFINEFTARMAAAGYPVTDVAATVVVDKMLETIEDEVAQGGEVKFSGFGIFGSVERAERAARNPRTGEAVTVPARWRAQFRPAPKFHDYVESQRETRAILADPGAMAVLVEAEVELMEAAAA